MQDENSEQDQTLEDMAQQPAVKQAKRSKTGTYIVLGLGALAAFSIYTGRRIWNYFYPPTFKRYFAAATMFGMFYSFTHCNKVTTGIENAVEKVKKEVSVVAYKNKQLKNTNSKLRTEKQNNLVLQNKNQELQEIIEEVTGSKVEFADTKPQYNEDIKNQKNKSKSSQDFSNYNALPGSLELLEEKLAHKYEHVLYVDKENNSLSLYASRNKELEFIKDYKCSTGRNPGPRTRQGDNATPEGVLEFSYRNASDNLPDLYGDMVIGTKSENPLATGVVLCGADNPARIRAINQGRNITNCGVITLNKNMQEIDHILNHYWSNSAMVVEHPNRPLVRKR